MQTQVLIIGGGATGTGLARDLALRGVPCVVVEKKDINAGASGGNHGLLHSGARYIASDPASACECKIEGQLLKKLAPHCIEKTGGLFVAVAGDDERYVADFPDMCARAGIDTHILDLKEARELEPALSERLIAAYTVDDATIDPFKLSLDTIATSLRRRQGQPSMKVIVLRSRIGKGPCQGTFCSLRVASYLYDRRQWSGDQGRIELRGFLRERWRGQQPLLWDMPLAQAELMEAMHCGLFGLELED